jgi:FecR protein
MFSCFFYKVRRWTTIVFSTILLCLANISLAESVGKILFSSAGVNIQSAGGAIKPAAKGVELESGDTIETGAGSIQMRMLDDAYFSLRPHTLFRFDDYHRNASDPAKERSFVSLLKGGLRSVTGLIGKNNHKNYRLNAPAATLGIRGTDFSVMSNDKGDTFSVSSGGVTVCNMGGCIDVDAGQSAFSPNQTIRPTILSELKSSIPIEFEPKLADPNIATPTAVMPPPINNITSGPNAP